MAGDPQTTTRTPTDGKPYYCTHCGAGFGEYMACEEMDCRLETILAAHDRRTKHLREKANA